MSDPRKLPPHLVLTAVLSGGLTIGLSLVYIVLCALALLFRHDCNGASLSNSAGSQYFWNTIYRAYILDIDCEHSIVNENLTREYTVFVLVIITLCISVLCLVTAITLVTVVVDGASPRHLNLLVFFYIGSCTASLVVDLTAASHFGIDYAYLSTSLVETVPGSGYNYETEVIRQGAFLLMGIALKGYIATLVNLILLIVLIVYVVRHHKDKKKNEHSIHKLGVLEAFDYRRPDDNTSTWARSQPDMYSQDSRRSQVNSGFRPDEEQLPRNNARDTRDRSDYNSNSFDRSDSWHHSQPIPGNNGRPFSYLEDVKRPVPTRPPSSPATGGSSWNRDPWPPTPPVPVPAPDYSPQAGRRLKSALKPAYM